MTVLIPFIFFIGFIEISEHLFLSLPSIDIDTMISKIVGKAKIISMEIQRNYLAPKVQNSAIKNVYEYEHGRARTPTPL